MAFPPPVLPVNRSNTTPQQDTHPNDHNAISSAINDTTVYVMRLGTEAHSFPSVTLGSGQTDAGQASLTDWLVTGITVPTWARIMLCTVTVTGIYEAAAGQIAGLPYSLALRIGAQQGFPTASSAQATNNRFTVAWNESFTLAAKGSLSIAVMAMRQAGGLLRFDAASRATFACTFVH